MLSIRKQLEAMLCPSQEHILDCQCEKLRDLYGHGLFKCDRYRCQYYHFGFETPSERNAHQRIHNRPFKCSEPSCEFADIGFISDNDLSRHISKIHHRQLSVVDTASGLLGDQFAPSDLFSMLEDAAGANEIEFVRNHYPRAKKLNGWGEWKSLRMVNAAATTASPTTVDFLATEHTSLFPDETDVKERALRSAIRGENVAVIRHLITQGANVNSKDISVSRATLQTWNTEIVELLLSHGMNLVECPDVFDPISRNAKIEEDVAFQIVDRMHRYILGKEAFSRAFRNSILSRGSIPLAKCFIGNGADVNYKYLGTTPALYESVKGFKPSIAEVIIFLLQNGADPYPTNSQKKTVASLAGMQRLEKHFGKSWVDLVAENQAKEGRHNI
jgi:hypothetical protein